MSRSFWAVMAVLCLSLDLCSQGAVQAAYDSAQLPETGPLTIERITPDGGNVFAVSQIVIEFNRPVVAIGKMERSAAEIPVEISPAVTCQWRWISTRTLACDLDEKQKTHLATEYEIKVRPGIKTLDGVTIAEPYDHSFTTQRPAPGYSTLALWRTQTRPIIRMFWTQPVSKSTMLKHVYFKDGHGTRYDSAVEADKQKRILPAWLTLPGEKAAVGLDDVLREQGAEAPVIVNGEEYRRIWLLEPTRDLPLDDTITLAAEDGVVSALGPLPSEKNDDVVTFRTFPAFAFLGVQCTPSDSEEDTLLVRQGDDQKQLCNPMEAISLRFTTPVGRKTLRDSLAIDPILGKPGDPTDVWSVNTNEDSDRVVFAPRNDNSYGVSFPYGQGGTDLQILAEKAQ